LGEAAHTLAGGLSGRPVEAITRTNFHTIVAANLITSGLPDLAAAKGKAGVTATGSTTSTTGAPERSLKDQLDLWEAYLNAETKLGLSDISRLEELRKCRDKARSQYEESERTRQAAAMGGIVGADFTAEMALSKVRGIFESSAEMTERYEIMGEFPLPAADGALKQRSKGKNLLEEVSKQETERLGALREGPYGGYGHRRRRERDRVLDAEGEGVGIASIVREFVPRLPHHTGPIPDIEGFIRQLRACVMPPRPADDGEGGSSLGKRGRDDAAPAGAGAPTNAADWLQAPGVNAGDDTAKAGDDDEEEPEDDGKSSRDDVFRQRQRAKLAVQQ
jgi:hypothetical protein